MGLDSTTTKLRKKLDEIEKNQQSPNYLPSLRHTRTISRASIARVDSMLGRNEIRRAIDAVLPKLDSIRDEALRAEIELTLVAAREHLR